MIKFRIGLIAMILTTMLFSSCNRHISQKEEKQKFYSCSMHPDYISYQPGKCSKCGMILEEMDLDNMTKKNQHSSHGGAGAGAGSSGGHHH